MKDLVRITAGFIPEDLWTPYERCRVLFTKCLGWLGCMGIQFGVQFIAKRALVCTVWHHCNGAAFENIKKSGKREVTL